MLREVAASAVPETGGVTYGFLREFADYADGIDWTSKDALNKLYDDAKNRVGFRTP